jgi:hypothetical protein
MQIDELVISEGSLVDRPANPDAVMLLFKHNDEDQLMANKTLDELQEAVATLEAQVGDLTKANADLTAELAESVAATELAKAELTKAMSEGEASEGDDEMPEHIRKRLDDAEAEAAASRQAIEKLSPEAAVAKMARVVEHDSPPLPISTAVVATALVKMEKGTPLESVEINAIKSVFGSHAELSAIAMAQSGKSLSDESRSGADAEVDQLASELRKAEPNLTVAQARAREEPPRSLPEVDGRSPGKPGLIQHTESSSRSEINGIRIPCGHGH